MTTRRSAARSGHPSARGTRRHHLPGETASTAGGRVGADPSAADDILLGDRSFRRGRRDPFVARVGAIVLAGVLLAPVVAALGSDDPEIVTAGSGGAVAMVGPIQRSSSGGAVAPSASTAPAGGSAVTDRSGDAAGPAGDGSGAASSARRGSVAALSVRDEGSDSGSTQRPTSRSGARRSGASASNAGSATAMTAAPTARRAPSATGPKCSGRYTARRGDYWIGIARRAGVELRMLLRANDATVNTPLYPGDRVCLPQGARQPGPPPTVPTTAAPRPRPTAPPAPGPRPRPTTPPTTRPPAPTTTRPPAPRPPSSYTRDEVLAIIREVWPDHLEERAIQIAWRESNWIPTARNYCCHGLFQIYFEVHRSWLGWFGVTSADGLYDPRINTMAAYHLYTRAGGWGPWGG